MKNKKLQKTLFGGNPRRFGAVTKKEENEYYAAEKEKKETAAAKKKYVEKRYKEEKSGTRNLDAPVTGKSFPAAYKKYKAERDAENGKMKGGKIMKKKMMGYKAGGLQMVEKDGKKVPFYAADGKGKMMMGGKVMGYKEGKTVKKKSKVKAKRGSRFNSSKELGAGFDQRLPSALVEEEFKKGIMGKYSPRAAIQGAISSGIDLFRSKEGKRGSRLAKEVAKKKAGKMAGGMMKKKMMGGGKVMGYKHGGKTSMPRGCGVATRQRPAKMVVMKGS